MRASDLLCHDILTRLIAFDTTSRNSNLEMIAWIQDYLAGFNIATELTYDDDQRKANLFATLGPAENSGGIILSGHTDVVPIDGQDWVTDPFEMTEKDGKLYGRGTCDMKSFVAVSLAMVPHLLKRGLKVPLHLAFSYDEEIGCLGVSGLIQDIAANLPLPRAVIVGEPTEMQLIGGNKGSRSFTAIVRGVPGHSSEPDRGANAIIGASRLVAFLDDYQQELRANADPDCPFDPPYTTFDIGLINGGTCLLYTSDAADDP